MTRHWAASKMSQMGLVKRLGCTTAKSEVLKFRRAKGGLSNQSEKIMTDRYLLKQLFARQTITAIRTPNKELTLFLQPVFKTNNTLIILNERVDNALIFLML